MVAAIVLLRYDNWIISLVSSEQYLSHASDVLVFKKWNRSDICGAWVGDDGLQYANLVTF